MSALHAVLFCLSLPVAAETESYVLNSREFQIPILVDPARRDDIREVRLYLSIDNGKTWNLQARATPDQKVFTVHAAKDGLHLFKVQVLDRKNQAEPADILRAPVGLIVRVESEKGRPTKVSPGPSRSVK
jgi:hypothetical protein